MAKGQTAKDLRAKGDDEIAELARTTKSELFKARFENYTNRLNDTAKLGKLRRDLARLNMVMSERRRAAPKKSAAKASAPAAAAKGEG